MKIGDAFEFYKQHILNKNLSEKTIKEYTKELNYFISFLNEINVENMGDIKGFHMDMFNAQLIRKGNKANTRIRKKSVINNFFLYCVKMEIIEKNPADVIGKIKVTDDDKKKKEIITDKEKEKILNKMEKDSLYKTKNKCLLIMILYSGIRVSEICGMKWEDIDHKEKTVLIRGKGRKNRKVPLVKEVEEELKQLKKEQIPESDYVFTAKKTGNPMKERSVHAIIKRYTKAAKIKKNIGPHRIRATAATNYLREGVNLRYIQMLLGHESLATTMLYMNPDEQEMNQAILEAAKKMKKKGKTK